MIPQLVTVAVAMLLIPAPTLAATATASRFVLQDRGQSRSFTVATNELADLDQGGKPEPIAGPRDLRALRREVIARRLLGRKSALVLYEDGVARTVHTRRVLTRDILVQTSRDPAALDPATRLAHREPGGATGFHVLTLTGDDDALDVAARLRQLPGVSSAEPLLARQLQHKALPTDPFFVDQWHLVNTGQNGGTAGIDIRVAGPWDTWRGAGMVIGIVDDGLQYTHPDLASNYLASASRDFNFNDADPSPSISVDWHGTCVAGLAAARGGNSTGVVGVAPEAKLAGLRLLAAVTTDLQESAAMLHSNQVIHVKNNSWGATDEPGTGAVLEGPGPLTKAAFVTSTTTGRGGRGEIFVFACGNGGRSVEDINYDGYANDIHVLPVGGVDDLGRVVNYSEPGACLVTTTPTGTIATLCTGGRQGLVTTDIVGSTYGYNRSGMSCEFANRDYTRDFGGTSGASPIAAGGIALLLQAAPTLGWRDVKEIVMRSSTQMDPASAGWATNRAGVRHHHYYGGGLMNVAASIAMATNWPRLESQVQFGLGESNLLMSIPDNSVAGVTRTFSVTNLGFRIEHVTLTLTAPHARYGDLAVSLISPGGIESKLAEQHTTSDTGYNGWTMSTVRHWGEPAAGVWTVRVADRRTGSTGTLRGIELQFYGSQPRPTLSAKRVGASLQLTARAAAPGSQVVLEESGDLLAWSTVTAGLALDLTGTTVWSTPFTSARRYYRVRLE